MTVFMLGKHGIGVGFYFGKGKTGAAWNPVWQPGVLRDIRLRI